MISESAGFAVPAGTVTLLLADIEGSSRLWEQDAGMADAFGRLDELVTDLVGRHDGVRPLEQGEGDSFVAAFSRASDAVACALALQVELAGGLIALRMGVHSGEVAVRDESSYVGPAINRCARIRDAAHGGQVILSQTAADLVQDHLPPGAFLRDLGSHRLRDLGREERLHQLCHPDLPAGFGPLRTTLDALAHNLPVELTSFVGRGAELAEVKALLGQTRLLTLLGSGGCGKTRLALQAGASVVADHRAGVWLVELADVGDAALVSGAIFDAVPLRERARARDLDSLSESVGDNDLLLVLDNCEHLVGAVAAAAEHLLRRCPSLSILATSREPLGVPGETTWRVPSLSFPSLSFPSQRATPHAALDGYEAVQLFVERARRARPAFALSPANSDAVAEICQRLDGIPLAIELAAARTRVLTPAQIREGLHDRFRLLAGGARTAVPRQQTLEASVEWSYDLLQEPERAMLRRLSVFAGGFTLEAAEAVGPDGNAIEAHHVLDLLSQLVDKSLVVVDQDEADGRFRLLDTVRHYAARQLREAGEAPQTQHRHFEFCAAFARRRPGEDEVAYRRRLDADYDNERRALAWAAEQDDPDLLLQLTRDLHSYWASSVHVAEACEWVRTALGRGPGAVPWVRARALGSLAHLALQAQDLPTAVAAADDAIALARSADDLPALVEALTTRGYIGVHFNEPSAATHTDEAAAIAEASGDLRGLAYILTIRGSVGLSNVADRPLSRAALARSIEVARQCGASDLEWSALCSLGAIACREGELHEGHRLLLQGAAGQRLVDSGYPRLINLWALVFCEVLLGELSHASEVCEELAQLSDRMGSAEREYAALADAELAFAEGDWARAIRRYRNAIVPLTARAGWAIGRLAWSELQAGDAQAARRRLDDFLATSDPTRVFTALPLAVRALVARHETELADAEAFASRALEASTRDFNHRVAMWTSLTVLAAVKTDLGEHETATRLWGAADASARSIGLVAPPAVTVLMAPAIAECLDALGPANHERAWAEGAALSLDEAVAYAVRGRGARRRPNLGWDSLTPTEHEVIRLVTAGRSNPDIAAQLFISRRTVTTHLTNIYRKLDLTTRGQLAAEATRRMSPERPNPDAAGF
jgi:predicted ATPase/class 3 adenylate cyclase/DNA-binding CsgD family transcriptional regulator